MSLADWEDCWKLFQELAVTDILIHLVRVWPLCSSTCALWPCRALFSKLQYLLDYAALLSSSAAETVSLRDIFGATEQDVARLRIVSLHDVDLEALASLPTVEGMDGGSGGKAGGETAQ